MIIECTIKKVTREDAQRNGRNFAPREERSSLSNAHNLVQRGHPAIHIPKQAWRKLPTTTSKPTGVSKPQSREKVFRSTRPGGLDPMICDNMVAVRRVSGLLARPHLLSLPSPTGPPDMCVRCLKGTPAIHRVIGPSDPPAQGIGCCCTKVKVGCQELKTSR